MIISLFLNDWCVFFNFSVCVSATFGKPSSPLTSIETLQNRPLRRIIKSVAQSLYVQSSTVSSNGHVSDTSINEILPQLYEMNTTNKINKCKDIVKIVNSTDISQNVSYCNQSSSEKVSKNSTVFNDTIESTTEAINVTLNVTLQSVEPISNISSSNDTFSDNENESTKMSSVSITGITFGVLMFIGILLTTSYILYRRNFTNKLHTLNDKCSNLDSSGYIDDSSIRVCMTQRWAKFSPKDHKMLLIYNRGP